MDEKTVRRNLKGFKRHLIPTDLEERFLMNLDKPLVFNEDMMITADWHIPVYDPDYVNAMIRRARAEGLTTLAIAGDFFNFDSLSAYDPKQDDANLGREYSESIAVMRVILETFDHIVYVWGNHDARFHRALGYAMQFSAAMKMVFGALGKEALERISFTNLDHFWIGVGKPTFSKDEVELEQDMWLPHNRWYICHPKNYTRTPLSTARKLAAKYNANVATAHSHHCAVGYAEDGEKMVAECGGLFDRHKTKYLQRSTTHPTWQQGFGWLKGGRFHLTSPGWETA